MIFQGQEETTGVAGQADQPPPIPEAARQPPPLPEGQAQQQQQSQPAEQQPPKQKPGQQPLQPVRMGGSHAGIVKPLIIFIAVIAIIAVVLLYMQGAFSSGTTTTVTTSTISNIRMSQISSCGRIDSPGNYYLSGSISTGMQEGACINVTVSNVSIVCNGNGLEGSGPYVVVPPFTYGVLVTNASNVSVRGCSVMNFSYGLYAEGVRGLSVTFSNLSRNYVSNVWLQNSSGSLVGSDSLDYNPSQYGAVHISGSSTNNTLSNSTVRHNSQIGISLNATGNSFVNDTVLETPVSFYCSGSTGFRHSNYAYGTSCYNSTGCAFVACNGVNVQPDLSNITLSSAVSSCGTISAPGTYTLQRDLDMGQYVDPSGTTQPCIEIARGNVTLDCDGHSIYNATTGINVSAGDVGINGCTVSGSGTGISVGEVSDVNLTNVTVRDNSAFGISLSGATNVRMANVTSRGNDYGISLSSSSYALVNRFSVTNNTFGIYLVESAVNTFENGMAVNNTKADVYASGNTINASSANLFQKSTCTVGDAGWADCKLHIAPSLEYYPIQSCSQLARPGTYMLAANLVGLTSTCFTLTQNGTTLDCDGHSILSPVRSGSAISAVGKTNILVEGCNIQGFHNGILAKGSQLFVNDSTITGSAVGINLTRSTASAVINNRINGTSNYGIYMANVASSVVEDNRINGGVGTNVGIYLNNSRYNHVLNNSMVAAVTGLYITGASGNNTVSANYGDQNVYDYVCSNPNSGMGAEQGGINFGTKKLGCLWMAAALPSSLPQSGPPCTTASKPTSFSLTNDYVYSSGATCFSIDANDTVIDCNGHTIRATDGGTFAAFNGSHGKSEIENCNLIGFTDAIVSEGSDMRAVNNTVYSNSSASGFSTAITVTGPGSVYASNNRLIGQARGLVVSNVSAGTVSYNNATGEYPYTFNGVTGVSVQANLASGASVAMSLFNSTENSFMGNRLYGTTGLLCAGVSAHSGANSDQGLNSCSSNYACGSWLTSSLASCPTT